MIFREFFKFFGEMFEDFLIDFFALIRAARIIRVARVIRA